MQTTTLNASADVGNSSTKLIVLDGVGRKARKQPSLMTHLPVMPKFEDEDVSVLVANLHKNIVVHVTSPAVTHNGLYAVGDLSNVYGGSGFNIEQHKKSDHNITIIQPLAMIAVSAIQNNYAQNNELPTLLTVDVEYTTAIPLVDYSKADAKHLENRLTGSHTLAVYVGEGLQVHVTIDVKGSKVVQEGIPAFYAILEGGPAMFEVYNKRYNTNFTGKDFVNRKMLFVDIGEGTTELIAIIDGKPVLIKSHGIRAGVGHVAEKALASFKSKYNFKAEITRQAFMKKVLDPLDKWHSEAANELKLATHEQEDKLFDEIISVIENTLANDLDDLVIFGGGANVFIELEQRLLNYVNRYKMRLLWIDGKEAALLNVIGLDELNTKVFFRKEV